MTVHIRERESSKGDKIYFYLEIYKGYIKKEDGSTRANRERKKLDYFAYAKPSTPSQKSHNKESKRKVEAIKGQVLNELLNGKYGFRSDSKGKVSFIEYFKKLTDERLPSKGNYGNWESVLKHLINFKGENISFDDVDVAYCEGFKKHLQNGGNLKSGKPLSSASVSSYFCKLRAALNQAVDDDIIIKNPSKKVVTPRVIEHKREYLTEKEIILAVKADCRYEVLKNAFLFSCLTGLRWSDISKLRWSEIKMGEKNWLVSFHQKKTKDLQYQNIPEDAYKLLGKRSLDSNQKVFVGLKYSDYMNVALSRWMLKAGITKHITFHCARHTYATMLLTKGVDIYTVSKLMGHSELKSTQVYANIIDQKKTDAVNTLNILNDE